MPPTKKLRPPLKKEPLVKSSAKNPPRKIWVFKWTWTLNPKVTAADIRGYKKSIKEYCVKKLLKYNIRHGTKYKPVPKWGKIIKIGNTRKLTVQFFLSPVPPKPVGGGAGLPPPPPPQPPPPPM